MTPTPTRAAARARLASGAVRALAALSRRAGAGSGSVIGGWVGLAIDPHLLGELGAGREIVLVSGTNGKTTTTAMVAAALGARGRVASSPEGANMTAGLVSALAASPGAPLAALEVDEGYLPIAIEALSPRLVCALNLSRDQLDRVGEVRMLAARWREAFARGGATVLANADDPLVCLAAEGATEAVYLGLGARWRADAAHCPRCARTLDYELDEGTTRGWSCRCGLRRPETIGEVDGGVLHLRDGTSVVLPGNLPGRFNQANAATAIVAAQLLGVEVAEATRRIAALGSVGGRFDERAGPAGSVRLLLAKNPAGWTEMLELVRHSDRRLALGLNAQVQDGRDPSWIWDVPFELLADHEVLATGERSADLALRLRHAGVAHRRVADPLAALARAAGDVDYVGNYSAFQQLRRRLGESAGATAPAPPAPLRRAPRVEIDGDRPPLRVVVVFPDLLGTYGDDGNALVLVNRARWRGIGAEVVRALADDPLPLDGGCYLLGGAEDAPQAAAAAALRDGRLAEAIARGALVLGVCAGFQLLGRTFPAEDRYVEGAGLLEMETVRTARRRAVGEVRARPLGELARLGPLTGFENHAGRTRLDGSTAPLARVERGVGNDERSHRDGARAGRVLGTYLHGPVLARNPALADWILEQLLGGELAPLDDAEERELRRERLARRALHKGSPR